MRKSFLLNTFCVGLVATTICLPVSAASVSADKAIQAAEAAITKANNNDWIWRDTEKLLSDAKAAADKGNEAAAVKLAEQARSQAEIAIEQYELEKGMDRSK